MLKSIILHPSFEPSGATESILLLIKQTQHHERLQNLVNVANSKQKLFVADT